MCKNFNSGKRSLVTTLIVVAVCLVIVTGSTFSLFTSKTGANIAVTAGNVQLTATIDDTSLKLYSMGVEQTAEPMKFENGGTAGFNADATTLTLTNITPGDKVTFEIDVTNFSNVDIQYRVTWAVSGKLAEVLTATVGGEDITSGTSEWYSWTPADADTKTLELAIEFPTGLFGTDYEQYVPYMGEGAEITFNVEAVQANATLEYDPTAYVSTAEAFKAAITSGATKIVINKDIELAECVEISGKEITLDLNGKKLLDESTEVLTSGDDVWGLIELKNGAKLTIEGDGTIECNYENVAGGWTGMAYAINVDATSELVINDGTFINGNGAIQALGKVIVNGGTFISHNGGTSIMAVQQNANVTVNDGIFKDYVETGDTYTGSGAVWAGFGATVVINGGTYDYAADPQHSNIVWTLFPAQNAIAGYGSNANMTVNGGTFHNFNPATDVVIDWSASAGFTFGSVVASDYSSIDNGDGTYTFIKGELHATPVTGIAPAPYVGDCYVEGTNVVAYKDLILVGDAYILIDNGASVAIENVTAKTNGSVVVMDDYQPAIYISGGNFTIPEGAYLIDASAVDGGVYQIFLVNVTVNGELLTQETAAQYLKNVNWYGAYIFE